MHWLLTEGGSSLAERTLLGESALLLAPRFGRFSAMQYLLEEHGVSMTESEINGTVWACFSLSIHRGMMRRPEKIAGLSSVLKVMVMLEDAPVDIIAKLSVYISSQHAEICTRGRQLRAQLPS
jgi:hypothetical protein